MLSEEETSKRSLAVKEVSLLLEDARTKSASKSKKY